MTTKTVCEAVAVSTCTAAFFSGVTAAGSAASGAAGAAILETAGHAAYDVKQSATAGAVGGAVAAIPITAVLLCCSCLFGSSDKNKNNTIGQFVLYAGIAALSGVLGSAILTASGDYETEMSAGQFAAATAVGSAVINGGIALLGAMCNR